MDSETSLSVLVCRGCCCGTQDGIDHDRHLAIIREAPKNAAGRIKVTNCIGPCDRKNVVVVRTRQHDDRWRSRYFAAVNDSEVEALRLWFASGTVQAAEPPELANIRFNWPIPRPRPAR
jgi:hypothetical protein